jgi:hypothetical protein
MKPTLAYGAGSVAFLTAAMLAACAASSHTSGFGTDGGNPNGDAGGDVGSGDDQGVVPPGDDGPIQVFTGNDGSIPTVDGGTMAPPTCQTLARSCSGSCTDFPAAPLVDTGAPANAATYFTAADGTGAAPCLVDPAPGTLFPQNWLRPRFKVNPATGQNLFEITLTTTRQTNPYVIYTSSSTWTMPKAVWDGLRGDSWGDTVNVKIRGVNTSGGAPTSATGSFTIAPALASGAMIYWAAVGDKAASGTTPAMSWLEGFAPGDESVATTLTTDIVQLQNFRNGTANLVNQGQAQCIGCHSAVPDGNSVTFLDTYPWPGSTADVAPVATADGGYTNGQTPTWLTPGGELALSLPWMGAQAFSKGDWANEKLLITSFGCGAANNGATGFPYNQGLCQSQLNGALMWVDLAAPGAGPSATDTPATVESNALAAYGTSWGFINRTGDKNGVEFPTWSHDGKTIVYSSTNAGTDGRLGGPLVWPTSPPTKCMTANDCASFGSKATCSPFTPPAQTNGLCLVPATSHLYSVPFNGKAGGAATPVPGASEADPVTEFYPAFSADDKFLAFVRAGTQGTNGMYYNPADEVYVVPFGGATETATRLAANDSPACESAPSPGVTNSWPKWSPDVESCPDGSTYYWLVFSSTRENIPFIAQNLQNGVIGPTSQLYITGISVDGTGKITTHPALYIWNQPSTDSLHWQSYGDGGVTPQSNHTPIWETINIPRKPVVTVQ